MSRDYWEAIDTDHPMGAARLVRRQRNTRLGGYQLALVTTGGRLLCPTCVEENFAHISWEHRHKVDTGWRPHGYVVIEGPGDDYCAHCGKLFWEEEVA